MFFRRNTGILKQSVTKAIDLIRQAADELTSYDVELNDSKLSVLSFEETDYLVGSLKKLFNRSDYDEQIRLLTLSPPKWGRVQIENFFGCNEWQARRALENRSIFGILSMSTNFSGNPRIDPILLEDIQSFYQDDSISRQSPNKKDVMHIQQHPMPVRFMNMTVGQAYQMFIETLQRRQYPDTVSKTVFYSMRPKWVKLLKKQDVCACIYHENYDFLLQVIACFLSNGIHSIILFRHGMNYQHKK